MFDPLEHMDALREAPTFVLEDVHAQLDVLESMVRAHRLLVLALLDERDIGTDNGAADTVTWLQRVGRTSLSDARAQVSTARALALLPAVAAVACEGQLGREQLRETALGATPETDEAWANNAPGWTPSMLSRARRSDEVVTSEDAIERHQRRFVSWQVDAKHGMVHGRFALADTDGATLVKALERMAEKVGKGPDGWEPVGARYADALVSLASHEIAQDADPDRATIVIHTPSSALRENSEVGGATLEDGDITIANATVRRYCCDARLQILEVSDNDIPLRLFRVQHTIPPYMRRLLRRRDQTCRWPGCEKTRALRGHHLQFWEDGGETNMENLAMLCTMHHRTVHEHGWAIRGDPNEVDGLEVFRPDGSVLETRPPPLDDHLRKRFVA